MQCLLCRYLIWSLRREKPDWVAEAENLDAELLSRGTNSDALALADRDPARLREVYELWKSCPPDAFSQFLSLAEDGSIWSMAQVGYAHEAGEGTRRDRVQAEKWYLKAYEEGSDFGLLRSSVLALKRGDEARAREILNNGISRGLTKAMTALAGMELSLSRTEEARSRARGLYEQAIALGDLPAKMAFARAMAHGRFGLKLIPTGIRSLLAAAKEFGAEVDARAHARSNASNV
jgi:TPR repeat protein